MSKFSPVTKILQIQERSTAPLSCDVREHSVLYRVVFGAIRRIMHNLYVHFQSVCEFHEILFYDMMPAGVGSSSVAKDKHGMGFGILGREIPVPDPFYIITDNYIKKNLLSALYPDHG